MDGLFVTRDCDPLAIFVENQGVDLGLV